MYFPFHEKLGLLLLRFLNSDLSNYETANKTFFYSYGFEILRDLNKNYNFELKQNYGSNEEYLKETNKIFEDLQEKLIDLQLAKDFETWKKQAKEKINLMKKGKLTENEVYEWVLKNK